ncbi:RNA polymerase sigma factor [Prauserella rugosa]|uniref:RNA polymerase sigma factor (Sigma-70 family) n=1 Tax=Prauserella rugosa TaxID=43354 RepID=A0A660C3P5_9PSEU|nr:RNA polymerase sigma factor [Prauserella rugosa]KMS85852.1 hypothetical protein ACZ91_40045 [Streptomyces regensis]TWH15984.1 RNA polymerase sigma factor (sigma-70 family) [Prauserella rugosa]
MTTPKQPTHLPRGEEWKPLLLAAQSGRPADFTALARPLSHWIARYARPRRHQIHRCGSTVDDIVQEALVRLWRSLDVLEWRSEGHLLAWVHTLTGRCIADLMRQPKRSWPATPAGTAEDLDHLAPRQESRPDREAELHDTLRQLQPAIAALAPRRREALVAHYLRDEPDESIAARLGSSISSVRVARHRALTSLRTTATTPRTQRARKGAA